MRDGEGEGEEGEEGGEEGGEGEHFGMLAGWWWVV